MRILPDEGPSLRVETLFSKTFAGVSDSRVNCLPSGMSVKSILRSSYGPAVTTVTTAYQRCLEKVARHRSHVVFNARCKPERIIPESLRTIYLVTHTRICMLSQLNPQASITSHLCT